jgi:hypothetical protein
VLVPEGRVVICGLNPLSLWGLRQRRSHACTSARFRPADLFLPDGGHDFIGYWRLRDWLRLLGFEVESVRSLAVTDPPSSSAWLDRWPGWTPSGESWWPIFGSTTFWWPSSGCAACAHGPEHGSGKRVATIRSLARRPCRSCFQAGSAHQTSSKHGKSHLNSIDIYTDGACKGNPGPGGWGVLLKSGGAEKELFGGERHHQQPHGDDGRD